MRYLMDTGVLLSVLRGDVDKNSALHDILMDKNAHVFASAASVLDVAIKKAMKQVVVPNDFECAIRESGFETLDVTTEHAWKIVRLPFFNADACDRLLIAQCLCEDLILITHSDRFDDYQLNLVKV